MASYINTRDTMGEQECLDALVSHSLKEFTDDTLSTLRSYAFYNNTNIEKITLPNVSQIPGNAFYGCSGMKEFHIGGEKNTVVPLSSNNAFTSTGRSIIYVPDDLVSNYRSASQWSTLAGRIYGENDTTAPKWDVSEIQDSWDTMLSRVSNGTAGSFYQTGQYKEIDLGTEGKIRFQVVAKNADELADGSGNAQLSLLPMELLVTQMRMNPALSGTTEGTGAIGGWEKCEMRNTHLLGTIWPLIPENIRNAIKPVKKKSRIYDTNGQVQNNVESVETIWLPSYREMFGGTNYETEGVVYDFAFPSAAERIRKRYGQTSASYWWLRSASDASVWRRVSAGGSGNYGVADIADGVGFGFCL